MACITEWCVVDDAGVEWHAIFNADDGTTIYINKETGVSGTPVNPVPCPPGSAGGGTFRVERADGSDLAPGPTGDPCVMPDQNWCDPADGVVKLIPKGQTLVTEENAPIQARAGSNVGTGLVARDLESGEIAPDYGGVSLGPIASNTYTNPDLCRSAYIEVGFSTRTKLEAPTGVSEFSVQLRGYADVGAGLNIFHTGTAIGHIGEGPDHPTPSYNSSNDIQVTVPDVTSVLIPPGGTITMSVQDDLRMVGGQDALDRVSGELAPLPAFNFVRVSQATTIWTQSIQSEVIR